MPPILPFGEARLQVQAMELAQQTMNLWVRPMPCYRTPASKKEVTAICGGGESVDRLYQGDEDETEFTPAASR